MEKLKSALKDYALPPVIRRSTIQENNFELKHITLQLIQNIKFMGLSNEDPNTHFLISYKYVTR